MQKLFFKLIVILTVWLYSIPLMAQPGDPGGDPDVPIDGGLGILLAAGALYGSKKIYDARKRK